MDTFAANKSLQFLYEVVNKTFKDEENSRFSDGDEESEAT